jgi:Tfp pilus assembly protein PilX
MEDNMRGLAVLAIASLLLAPAAAMAQTAAPAASPSQPAPATAGSRSGTTQPGANQFSSETAAKQACAADTIVWVNTGGSKAWHVSGDKYYGHTKHGAYMCEQAAKQAGYHPPGSRAHHASTKAQ